MKTDLVKNATVQLRPARVHEAEGLGAGCFAAFQMGQHNDAIFWISLAHQRAGLLPSELPRDVQTRLIFIETSNEDDLLWATEEALRVAHVGLVIAQPEKPLSLTVGRRLQLAAEAGQTTGLMLIREGQGSNAAETRWHCTPAVGEVDSTLHHWQLIRNKMGTCGEWIVNWDGKTAACHMAKEVPK